MYMPSAFAARDKFQFFVREMFIGSMCHCLLGLI